MKINEIADIIPFSPTGEKTRIFHVADPENKVVAHPAQQRLRGEQQAASQRWNNPSEADIMTLLQDLADQWGYLNSGETRADIKAAEEFAISNGLATPQGDITQRGLQMLHKAQL